ncbi:phosphoribosylformylglycinamidine cyclo-ligase [Ruminococcaceae bacterium OttesenSCG-928-O06]|nr:phosphoribosylformylglycinamidine cyclo-ligase [Ruminococcaceae bacterium OttesenSCG-928-O06]
MKSQSESYRAAGVDITAGYEAVQRMRAHVERTYTPGVLGGLGGFGGLFAPNLTGMKQPVLVSGADGVGTKLRVALYMDKHDTIGIDSVAMCVNDILCAGAAPLFFLDYIACGRNNPQRIEAIVAGVAEGCVQAGCALVGGETAEHPGVMPPDEYDLAGFAVGLVDRDKMLDTAQVQAGDVLVGLPSSGVHSNGFSLVRHVFSIDEAPAVLGKPYAELGTSLGQALLQPTCIYVKPVLHLLEGCEVHGLCHITGGGFYENIPRMLPGGLAAKLDVAAIPPLPIFDVIAKEGGIPPRDMYNTFNMGVGMCAAVPAAEADKALGLLRAEGQAAFVLGEVVPGEEGVLL